MSEPVDSPPVETTAALFCHVCFKHFRGPSLPFEPKFPTCIHPICASCSEVSERTCGTHAIANVGITTYVEKLFVRSCSEEVEPPVPCEDCFALDEQPCLPSVMVCEGCKGKDRHLCHIHGPNHEKRGHASLKPIGASSCHGGYGKRYCSAHPGTLLNRVCLTDNTPVCAQCCLVDHPLNSHKVHTLEEAAADLGTILAALTAGVEAHKAAGEAVHAAKTALLCSLASTSNDFDVAVDGAIASLNALRATVKAQAAAEAKTRVTALDAQLVELSVTSGHLNTGISMIVDAFATRDPQELAQAHHTGSLLAQLAKRADPPRASTTITISHNMVPLLASIPSLAGVQKAWSGVQMDASRPGMPLAAGSPTPPRPRMPAGAPRPPISCSAAPSPPSPGMPRPSVPAGAPRPPGSASAPPRPGAPRPATPAGAPRPPPPPRGPRSGMPTGAPPPRPGIPTEALCLPIRTLA